MSCSPGNEETILLRRSAHLFVSIDVALTQVVPTGYSFL